MMVSRTSLSLVGEGGSSAVCSSVKPRIDSWHYWNYFRRHSYRDEDAQQHALAGTIHPSHPVDERIARMQVEARSQTPRPSHEKARAAVNVGPRAGVITVADEANKVASDVVGDVANDDRHTRQHGEGSKALQGAEGSCQHLIGSAYPPRSMHDRDSRRRGTSDV